MPFMTSFEIDGRLKSSRESVIAVLETRFGSVPDPCQEQVNRLEDLTLLQQLLKQAVTVASIAAFEEILAEI